MVKNFKTVFAVSILTSTFAGAEVHQCEIDGKLVFQQMPCPIETVDTGCNENYDYSDNVASTNASFDDRYCYYLQLDRLDKNEKQRLMTAYKERNAGAVEVAIQNTPDNKMTSSAQETTDYSK